jgi:hypothetical protein
MQRRSLMNSPPCPDCATARLRRRAVLTLAVLLLALTASLGSRSTRAAEAAEQDEIQPETPWPHTIVSDALELRIYQPQLETWDGSLLKVRAAVSAAEGKDSAPTFGIVELQARTLVDKQQRIVTLDRVDVVRADFPSAPYKASEWAHLIEADSAQQQRTIALDRLEAGLEIIAAEATVTAASVRNDPPRLIFSTRPAMLIYVDGTPAYRTVADTTYQRVVNTRALILRRKGGVLFLRIFDGWMTSSLLSGPWSVARDPPADLAPMLKAAVDSRQVDLLTGQTDPEQPGPSLATGAAPDIYIATTPTELLVTDGEPKWVPIPGTQLLYAENTTGHVFKLVSAQKTYVLASGRWFRAQSTNGPWEFVPADKLAPDFANIPDDSPKENVKASVAGATQAKEAAIAASIPETAAVQKTAKMTTPTFDGEPKLLAIKGTSLQYVVNSPTPIIMVDAHVYYAVENGVWFTASNVRGPWTVATSVPAVIYTIPASSPLHYVTYVKVYDVEGEVVYVGYTPGYEGEYVDPTTEVVVYGTGYYYTPWVGTVWYGPPVTYGFGVALRYTPWTGWAVGYGFGWTWGAATVAVGWGWGPYPWWGPYGWGWSWGPPMYPIYPVPYWRGAAVGPDGAMAWGPGGWVGTTGNMYRRWGPVASVSRASAGYNAWTGNAWAGEAGMAYNSRTGTLAAGQRGAVSNVYTGRYAEGARGAATNAGAGVAAATRQGTIGNAATGSEVSAGQSAIYNRNTGEVTRTGHVSGEQGTIARVGDDVYAGHDGNVYQRTDDGWQQMPERDRPSTERPSTMPAQTQQQLDRDMSARSHGAERYAGRQQSVRAMPRGGGRRR